MRDLSLASSKTKANPSCRNAVSIKVDSQGTECGSPDLRSEA